jgi:predicted thioesterase
MRVRARAELVKVDGRTLTFRIDAEDERESVGEGAHERLIINVERFDQRMQKKLAR